MKGFARREFQLMLLRRMADYQPELVEAACDEIGASHGEYLAAHNRWQSMLRAKRTPRGLELYRAVLGPVESVEPRRVGDVTVTACQWSLGGLWPSLRWEAVVGLGNVVLHGWLVRARSAPPPDLAMLGLPAPGLAVPDKPAPNPTKPAPDRAVPDPPAADLAAPGRLAPWSCVVGDVLERFPHARQEDPEVASRWLVHVDGWQLWFVHGLLQTSISRRSG